jgi:hypothetical protein
MTSEQLRPVYFLQKLMSVNSNILIDVTYCSIILQCFKSIKNQKLKNGKTRINSVLFQLSEQDLINYFYFFMFNFMS